MSHSSGVVTDRHSGARQSGGLLEGERVRDLDERGVVEHGVLREEAIEVAAESACESLREASRATNVVGREGGGDAITHLERGHRRVDCNHLTRAIAHGNALLLRRQEVAALHNQLKGRTGRQRYMHKTGMRTHSVWQVGPRCLRTACVPQLSV